MLLPIYTHIHKQTDRQTCTCRTQYTAAMLHMVQKVLNIISKWLWCFTVKILPFKIETSAINCLVLHNEKCQF